MIYEARQPDTLKSGFFSLLKIPVNTVFGVFCPLQERTPDYRQKHKIPLKNFTRLFILNGAPQVVFSGTGYTLGWQGIHPPIAAMTICLRDIISYTIFLKERLINYFQSKKIVFSDVMNLLKITLSTRYQDIAGLAKPYDPFHRCPLPYPIIIDVHVPGMVSQEFSNTLVPSMSPSPTTRVQSAAIR